MTETPQVADRRGQRQRRFDAGELVSNDMYRERVLWLQANDPRFDMSQVCRRLTGLGYPKFWRTKASGYNGAETSYLQRLLGLRRQTDSKKRGRPYHGNQTKWIERDLASALYVALDMDPLIENGDVTPPPIFRDHRSRTCAWGEGCSDLRGHGQFGSFCAKHAKVIGRIRRNSFTDKGHCRDFGGARDYRIFGARQVLFDEELDLVEAML